ncbi:MAG: hypothetical protein SGJ16_06660 [Nitrospirota bacterium]|nr:hypothetical protein [Nitrospirota bacterium]
MNDLDQYLQNLSTIIAERFQEAHQTLALRGEGLLSQQLEKLKYAVFYSNPTETLKPGELYLIGLNPGGSEKDKTGEDISYEKESFKAWQTMKAWYPFGDDDCGDVSKRTQLQRRICSLIEELQKSLPHELIGTEYVFASNLYFFRTPDQQILKDLLKALPQDLGDCWYFHREFLEKVQPRAILTFGNGDGFSTFTKVCEKLGGTPEPGERWNGRVRTKYSIIQPFWNRRRIALIGLPHLSRYWFGENRREDVVDELRRLILRCSP